MGLWTMMLWVVVTSIPDGGTGAATQVVKGKVMATQTQWGGARPTEEQERRRAQPIPLAKEKYLVRRGTTNDGSQPVAELVSDRHGAFELSLPPGKYCVVNESKRVRPDKLSRKTAAARYLDPACLQREWATCDQIWDVGGPRASFDLHLVLGGPPLCYFGPGPPSARP